MTGARAVSIGWSPGRRCCCSAASRRSPIGSTRRCSLPAPRRDGSSRHDPDLFIERFSAVNFDVDGQPRQMLAATRAEHFPDDGSVELTRPRFAHADRAGRAFDGHRRWREGLGRSRDAYFAGTSAPTRDAAPATARDATAAGPRRSPPTPCASSRRRSGPRPTARDDRGAAWNNPGRRADLDNKARTVKLKSPVRGSLRAAKCPPEEMHAPLRHAAIAVSSLAALGGGPRFARTRRAGRPGKADQLLRRHRRRQPRRRAAAR